MCGLVTYKLLQVTLHYYQSVCRPLWLLLKQAEGGLHGYGECLYLLHWQFRHLFLGSGQSDESDNWNKESLKSFEMCLRAEPHLYVSLAAVYRAHNVTSKCHLL
jgi:hypothetical protein